MLRRVLLTPILFATVLLLAAPDLSAQTPQPQAVSAAGAAPHVPLAQRPTMAVRDFDFAAQLSRDDQNDLNSYGGLLIVLRGGDPTARSANNTENLAKATSTLLAQRLLATRQFRVLERARLVAVTAEQDLGASGRAQQGQANAQTGRLLVAKYVVTGTITKFGKSKKKRGGIGGAILGGLGGVAGVSSGSTDYEVGITVNVADATTGEMLASFTTDGVATGDRHFSIGGGGGVWGALAGGAFSRSATDEREKRISEALQNAIDAIAAQVLDARMKGDL